MVTKEEIRDLKQYLVEQYYKTLRREQQIDQEYYDDKFAVPQIKNPGRISRTGRASRLVDAPSEHIITSNPQVLYVPGKPNTESQTKITAMINQTWIPVLKRQNPNPFKEAVRNPLLRGECFIQLVHNEKWVTGDKIKKGLPVLFLMPDPMIVFADPNEDENGIPARVIIWYERLPWIVKNKYPDWSNPKNASVNGQKNTVEWLEYHDSKSRYFEADGDEVLKGGIQDNIYGVTPFIHFLTGFGKNSPTGEIAELVVGRLRKSRDTLIRECAITSSIDSIIYLLGQPQKDFKITEPNTQASADLIQEYTIGLAQANIIPYGVEVVEANISQPSQEMFQHLFTVRTELEREDPSVLAGIPSGASGRQQDAVGVSAMRRYESLVENCESAFSTAFNMALKIVKTVPGLMPDEIKKSDIPEDFNCVVKLKAADPIEDDRKATLGSRLYQTGEIDLMTNLVGYQGYTEDKAQKIITKILADKVTIQSPEIAELMGVEAARELGMEDEYAMLKQKRQMLEQQQAALSGMPAQGGGEPRVGNIQSEMSREVVDKSLALRGQRSAPARYERG